MILKANIIAVNDVDHAGSDLLQVELAAVGSRELLRMTTNMAVELATELLDVLAIAGKPNCAAAYTTLVSGPKGTGEVARPSKN